MGNHHIKVGSGADPTILVDRGSVEANAFMMQIKQRMNCASLFSLPLALLVDTKTIIDLKKNKNQYKI